MILIWFEFDWLIDWLIDNHDNDSWFMIHYSWFMIVWFDSIYFWWIYDMDMDGLDIWLGIGIGLGYYGSNNLMFDDFDMIRDLYNIKSK